MDAKIVKLDRLLQENSILEFPLVQRKYEWGKVEVNCFIDDVILQGKNNDSKEYFLGTMLLREDENINLDGITHSMVYEGQQRLITTTLTYYALYLFLRDNSNLVSEDFHPEVLLKYVYNNNEKTETKLKLNSTDHIDFQNILEGNFVVNESHMYKMFKLIQKRVTKTNCRYILTGLRKLKVILAKLSYEDNADLIFDTVNTRGKPLGFIDNLRNICLLNLEPKLQEEIYTKKWIPFYDSFMKYHFDDKSKRNEWAKGFSILYKVVRSERANGRAILKYLRTFDSCEAMDKITEYNNILIKMIEKSRYQKQISQLLLIDSLSGIMGVYLIDKTQKKGYLNRKQTEKLINLLVSYSVRSWVIHGKQSIPYLVWEMSLIMSSNNLTMYQDLLQLFTNYEGKRNWEGIPTNDCITDVLCSKEWMVNKNAAIMLTLIERGLNVRCGDLSDMTVEHILPMKFENKSTALNVKRLLGNLTLIPQSENSRLSNNDFLSKKQMKGGFDESTFIIDQYIKEQKEWGETEIMERTVLLAQEICNIWNESVSEGVVCV